MCIPGKAQLSLTLPIESHAAVPNSRYADLFAATRKSLPRPAPANWKFGVADLNDSFVLTANVSHKSSGPPITQATFFPLAESQIENSSPQKLLPEANGFRLTLRKSDRFLKPIARLKGVLELSAGDSHLNEAFLIDAPVSKPSAARASSDLGARAVQ
jgi:DsbC/DsbD-like thiol-disulfide interchange protein